MRVGSLLRLLFHKGFFDWQNKNIFFYLFIINVDSSSEKSMYVVSSKTGSSRNAKIYFPLKMQFYKKCPIPLMHIEICILSSIL